MTKAPDCRQPTWNSHFLNSRYSFPDIHVTYFFAYQLAMSDEITARGISFREIANSCL